MSRTFSTRARPEGLWIDEEVIDDRVGLGIQHRILVREDDAESLRYAMDDRFPDRKLVIRVGGRYRTRDGQVIRVLCVDGPTENYPVIGVSDFILTFTKDGRYRTHEKNDMDLIGEVTDAGT